MSSKPTLLIDEPELGVDQNNLNYIKAFLALNRTQRGRTILFATHDLDLASNFADLCVMIEDGKIVFVLPPVSQKQTEDWFYNNC